MRYRAKAIRPASGAGVRRPLAAAEPKVAPPRALGAGNAIVAHAHETEADRVSAGEHAVAAGKPLGSRGGGAPLPVAVRSEIEAATGANLAAVRVHDGPAADREARTMHARAFARGDDIGFAAGEYRPDSADGRGLIEHEVGHVLQQRRDGVVRIDRQPAPSPQAAFEQATKEMLLAALKALLRDKRAFWDILIDEHRLDDKLLERSASVSTDDKKVIVDWVHFVLTNLVGVTATIELADQTKNETVDWDSACKLLSTQLGAPELSSYGLPTSFGTDLFVNYTAEMVGGYIATLAQTILDVYTAFDPSKATGTLNDALEAALDKTRPGVEVWLQGVLQDAVVTWGDPFGLLELELEGAIAKLGEARAALKQGKTNEERAAAGKKINFIARMILAIDLHLVDADTRKQRRETGERVSAIGATDDWSVSTIVGTARGVATSEETTLQYRGNQRSELIGHSIGVDRPLLAPMAIKDGVSAEEAYPHYTDQVTIEALRTLAAQASTEAAEVENLRNQIVPARVVDLVNFGVVYKTWFGFYSGEARANDPGFAFVTQMYKKVMPLAAMGGPEGWLGRMFFTQAIGSSLQTGTTNARSFQSEVDRIKFQRSEQTSGGVAGGSGGGTDVKYETAELPVGSSGARNAGGEAAARNSALSAQAQASRQAFTTIYSVAPADMVTTAAALGRYHGSPGETKFWDPHDLHKDRTGFDTSWSYLMATEVFTSSLDIKTVHEHKVMRDEVARYLIARTQALNTHSTQHHVRDEYGESIAELETAKVTAEARYIRGEDDSTTNSEAEGLKAKIRAAKAVLDQNTPERLVADLEAVMSDFFAYADPATRVLAILIIGVYEDDLVEELMSGFNAKAIAWAVAIAAGISALLFVLSLLGELGQLAAAIIQRNLHKIGLSVNIAALITIGQWAINAGLSSSFGDAERWAYVGADVAGELSQLMRDYALAKAQKGLKWAWDWSFKSPPSGPKAVGANVRESLGKDPAGREMLDQVDQAIRKSLDAGDTGLVTKDSIEFLKAADPDAYARLARDYPNVFKDVITPRPELRAGSAAADMHTLVQAGIDPKIAGRVNVIEVPGDSVRVRVKNGIIEVEVGRKAATNPAGQAILEGHLGAVKRLGRYVGPVGQVRHMLARVGAALGFLTIHTRGGEAADEIKKLTDIRDRLEALRSDSESKLGKWADKPSSISDADLDAEIAKIQKQIDGYMLELDSTVIGKGYIASEGNFAEIEKAGILDKPLDVKKLEELGYRVDKNKVIYRPKGGTATMEPLEIVNGKVRISEYESPAAVQARVRERLPKTKQDAFDAMANAAPKGTKVRLVEGIHDTGATWKEVFGNPRSTAGKARRAELKAILTEPPIKKGAGLSSDEADRLIDGLIDSPETLKVVLGTDPVRTAHDYRTTSGTTGDDIAHHFDPLYLGGGHKLIAKLPSGAHDRVHRFFDELTLPSTGSPAGSRLQPGELQSKVRATAKPAVVVVDQGGNVSYKLDSDPWKL